MPLLRFQGHLLAASFENAVLTVRFGNAVFTMNPGLRYSCGIQMHAGRVVLVVPPCTLLPLTYRCAVIQIYRNVRTDGKPLIATI